MDAIFPGLQAMENVHPLFVHIPVVLLPLALAFQVAAVWQQRQDCQQAALWLLLLGTLGALASAGSGLLAEAEVTVPEPAWDVIELHKMLMLVVTALAVLLSLVALVRRRRLTARLRVFLLVGLLVLSGVLVVGAHRGGQLVYQYRVGVHSPPMGP